MRNRCLTLFLILAASAARPALAGDGNRLTYLDGCDPYYVSRSFPRLTTPMWVGEQGVEAVVILSIDDMKDSKRYESHLRPILNRLKQIEGEGGEGRAAHSIMTCVADPADAHLQTWLKEGVSLETHTFDHPCPVLAGGDFQKAAGTFNRCVDLLADVPNNRPVAFRTPCCDSKNTLSPRLLAEIFNRKTPKGNFLQIDSSVFNVLTPNDPELPRALVMENGQERYRRYGIPGFVNTIDDYGYPYVIDRLCWEIPCATPTDWQAQNYHKEKASPLMLKAWKDGLDAAVIKQGLFCLVYHPWGWSTPQQIVDLIDHAVAKHGKKVKFLTFKDVLQRLNRNLLGGQSLRSADGGDNGVRLLDLNNDGFIDVVIGNDKVKQTRVWSPKDRKWIISDFPTWIVKAGQPTHARFGILHADGLPTCLVRGDGATGAWHFDGKGWIEQPKLIDGLEIGGKAIRTGSKGRDRGVRLRDLDGDGICELIVGNPEENAVFALSNEGEKAGRKWTALPFKLPGGATIVNDAGQDNGLRFVDIDEDGHDDVYFANEEKFGLHLFTSLSKGWTIDAASGKRGDMGALPPAARNGMNDGLWFHSRKVCVQNENVAKFESVGFNDLLAKVEPRPRSPEAARRSIQVHAGFEVELVAAEPLVQSPISFAWGADGKFWVVEMGDYPLGLDGKGQPGGRVKYLEDTQGTGTYDKATVFLDGLAYPTSVLPWRKGVIVTCAPEIFYAEDTKGTGKADLKVPLFTGFTRGNPQHLVNTLAWGLDNWIYVANGDSGGEVKSVKTGQSANIRGRDLRIRPDDGLFDLQAGQTQYVRSRDDWNHWFGNNNSNPMWHYVLADHYLRRNPAVPAPSIKEQIIPKTARVYPISRTLPRFNDFNTANHFTSACSAIVYRDDLLGADFRNCTFVSEPVHNLVHREVLSTKDCTFLSKRPDDEQTSEFLATSDNWFRPTTIQTGPDGALWIADMYRAVIEHPQWIPRDWQKKLDLRAGHERGRIYRVVPVGAKRRPMLRLDKLHFPDELVAALDSPSGWQRDTVQQMLLWRNDRAVFGSLVKLINDCPRPQTRAQALCTLDGLAEGRYLTVDIVLKGLRDPHPGVREQAVRLVEGLLKRNPGLAEHKDLAAQLLKMTADADPFVRLQLACTLGEWPGSRAGTALAKLASKDSQDRFITAAVLSSVNAKNLDETLRAVVADKSFRDTANTRLIEDLLKVASSLGNKNAMAAIFGMITVQEKPGQYAIWQYRALAGLLDFLERRNTSLAELQGQGADLKKAVEKLDKLFVQARQLANNPRAEAEERVAALALLGRGPAGNKGQRLADQKLLTALLVPQTPGDVQAAAIAALGHGSEPAIADMLLSGWKGYSPPLRKQVLDTLLGRPDWVRAVLGRLEKKTIPLSDLDAARRQTLLQHADAGIRKRAQTVLAAVVDPDRARVLAHYEGVVKLKGDAKRGAGIFAKNCAQCHRLGNAGHAVGPDIESIGDRSTQALLIAILDPNRVVEARYVSYTAVTRNGLTLTGLLASETGNGITLLAAEARQHVILRTDLEELFSSGKSPMPEGMEKEIDPQAMADLIAHIQAGAPMKKAMLLRPGNRPAAAASSVEPTGNGVTAHRSEWD